MRRHVQKRMQQGWKLKTIADRLGITIDQVLVFAGASLVNRAFNSTPRLVTSRCNMPQSSAEAHQQATTDGHEWELPGLLQGPDVPVRTTHPPDFHFDNDAFGDKS